jgi:hypothetical protein
LSLQEVGFCGVFAMANLFNRLTKASRGNTGFYRLSFPGFSPYLLIHFSENHGECNYVGLDAVATPLSCNRLGKQVESPHIATADNLIGSSSS